MAANPDPARIPEALWWFWEQADRAIPGVQLGGIYADKECYHNTVAANLARWPDAYCVQLPLDLVGPRDKARAVDLTMSTEQMILRTGYLVRAALHPEDTRLYGLREFIGTTDGRTVVCYIRDTDSGPWRFQGGRDLSHLWHIHGSWWTNYCNDMAAAAAVLSVIEGVTWEEYQDMGVYYQVTSTDPAFGGSVWMTDGIRRRRLRNPGVIHERALVGRTKVVLTDADRLRVGAGETWDSFLTAVAGVPWDTGLFTAADRQVLADTLTAAEDDGDVNVVIPPEALGALHRIEANMVTSDEVHEAVDEELDEAFHAAADPD